MQPPGGPGGGQAAAAWQAYYARQAAAQQYAQQQAPGGAPAAAAPGAHQPGQPAPGSAEHTAAWQAYYANQEAWRRYYTSQGRPQPVSPQPGYPAAPAPGGGYPGAPGAAITPLPPPSVTLQKNPTIAGFRAGTSQPMGGASVGPASAPRSYAQATAGAAHPGGKSGGKKDWPPALKSFVERCFEACRTDPGRKQLVTDELKRIIERASSMNALWTNEPGMSDWDTMPVPAGRGPERVDSPSALYQPYGGGYVGHQQTHMNQTHVNAQQHRMATPPVPQSPKKAVPKKQSKKSAKAAAKAEKVAAKEAAAAAAREAREAAAAVNNKKKRGPAVPLEEELDTDAERAKRARRMGRFGTGEAVGGGQKAAQLAAERHERLKNMKLVAAGVDNDEEKEEFWDSLTIRGTNTTLEKSYFRLTSAPDPATVRPQPVLEKALLRLKTEAAGESYFYLQDQMKALRQDLTVQRIRNSLTAEVYEHHARVALANQDLGEFNQCQTVLKTLYGEGVRGQEVEFLAYRVLYSAITGVTGSNINTVLSTACAMRTEPAIAHALAVRNALQDDNAVEYFRLLGAAPSLGHSGTGDLMSITFNGMQKSESVRFKYLQIACKTFQPKVPVAHLARVLGFTLHRTYVPGDDERQPVSGSDGAPRVDPPWAQPEDIAECTEWLRDHGAVVSDDKGVPSVDCKESGPNLFVPEDKNAVAHGDQTLDIADFMASF